MGSPILAKNMPKADSILVERTRAAGAILIGKTNTPEFGLGSQSYNTLFGATGCAFDPSKTAGGSSGGAAAARSRDRPRRATRRARARATRRRA